MRIHLHACLVSIMISVSVVPGSVIGQGPGAAPASLDTALESIRERHKVPALAAVVVRGDQIVAIGAVGARRNDAMAKVTTDDRWHLGSCTKSITATMLARLVEQGKLSLNTTLAQAFPEFSARMNPQYRAVTLQMLLNHRAGLPTFLSPTQKGLALLNNVPADPIAGRHAFALGVLQDTGESAGSEI